MASKFEQKGQENTTSYNLQYWPCYHGRNVRVNKLKILPLSKISDYSIIILMYKYARGMLPSVFNDMFIRNYEIHSYNTRQSTKIHVPKVKTAAYHNSFKYKGTLLWNFISDKINCNCSLAAYKLS